MKPFLKIAATTLCMAAIMASPSAIAAKGPSIPVISAARISDNDYPKEALVAGIEGDVMARFVVDTKGRVSQCNYQADQGATSLGDKSCVILTERFRYTPARDDLGNKIEATIEQPFAWRIKRPCQPNLGANTICIAARQH